MALRATTGGFVPAVAIDAPTAPRRSIRVARTPLTHRATLK